MLALFVALCRAGRLFFAAHIYCIPPSSSPCLPHHCCWCWWSAPAAPTGAPPCDPPKHQHQLFATFLPTIGPLQILAPANLLPLYEGIIGPLQHLLAVQKTTTPPPAKCAQSSVVASCWRRRGAPCRRSHSLGAIKPWIAVRGGG